jgi:transcriptional regulator with XRE-family HTH domain
MLLNLQYLVDMKARPNRLRIVRAEKRVTQEALERRTRGRISQTKVSQIENGYLEPTLEEARLIARALDVPIREIFPASEAVAS